MAVPKKRTGHSAQGHRRSNWKATKPATSKCQKCGELTLAHTVCTACGSYKGQPVRLADKQPAAATKAAAITAPKIEAKVETAAAETEIKEVKEAKKPAAKKTAAKKPAAKADAKPKAAAPKKEKKTNN